MATFKSFPRHLRALRGEGLVTCALSGFLRRPKDIEMVDGVPTAKDKADFYGKFGYDHPQDVPQPEIGGDPSPVDFGGLLESRTKQDMGMSDQEIEAAIRENRPPREGY